MTGSTAVGAAMVNEVRLVGRLSGAPEDRVLPSGDRLTTFRVVVDRSPRRGATRREVDTIDCVASRSAVVRAWPGSTPGTWSRWKGRSTGGSGAVRRDRRPGTRSW